ncbi:lysophospholipid acyltransferase family protein [Roseivirga thermotolerans]|jgi:KDO2-lipid IV(A) lauroyltransferase|uniref:lysophospholipid acyltransferase family protein n=1 Tax=Roseivirga thermotolerans TaxID=1758176 RepID=UPI00273E80E3|nr:lysophospholipid acyltransferase family protein [Roseivirga thermotolerans]
MMRLFYYLFLKPVSLLPWPLLYAFSDFAYLLLFRVFRYRSKIVTNNLKRSFPGISEEKLKEIRSGFYHHFFDGLFETFKTFSMTNEEALARFRVINPDVADRYQAEGRSVIMVGGHYNNWEYLAMSVNACMAMQTAGIYQRIKSKFFEKKILESRKKFGMHLFSRSQVQQGALDNCSTPLAIFFAIDQSPTLAKKVYWTTFLNQETAVAFGPEKFARKLNAPVVYFQIDKIKRGYYEATFKLLTENPLDEPHGAITEMHTQALEQTILNEPKYWLWSHKRWKRKRKPGE